MRRFFYNIPNQLQVGKTLPLTDDIFHHWCKVLRANTGDTALLFDGIGGEYSVTLTQIHKKSALVSVENFNPINRDLPYQVHIGLVMSRGERMDYAIQKATEMGVYQIHLLTSQHGEVRLKPDQVAKKVEHWQGVAISACEQCGLNIVPKMIPPIPIDNWLLQIETIIATLSDRQNNVETKIDKNDYNGLSKLLKLVLAVPKHVPTTQTLIHISQAFHNADMPNFCLLIGAEGGLSEQEIDLALAQGFLPWQIGERVLRTETAPVVALTALQTIMEYQTIKNF